MSVKGAQMIIQSVLYIDFVKQMYPDNPNAVHAKLAAIFDSLGRFGETDMANIYLIVVLVSQRHPEVNNTAAVLSFRSPYKFIAFIIRKARCREMPIKDSDLKTNNACLDCYI